MTATPKHFRVNRVQRSFSALTTLLILLLAALLRFYHLSSPSLWADEGNSVALARRSFVEIARRTAFDIHPPLYYWLLRIWIIFFGDSEIGLRSLSVGLGIAVVYLTAHLGARLFNRRVGLIAAFLAAISPLQIYYAQEARMYMLLTFVSSLTVLIAFSILTTSSGPGKKPILLGFLYVLTVTAGLYTHYAYPLIWLAVNLAALFRFLRGPQLKLYHSPLLTWLLLQLLPLLFYQPWLPTAWRQLTTWPASSQPKSLFPILETISSTLLFGLSWPYNLELLAAGGLGLVLLFTVWLSLGRSTPYAGRLTPQTSFFSPPGFAVPLLWLWFVLPVALTAFIFSPAFLKFLLVATPPLAILLALVIAWLTHRRPARPGSDARHSSLAVPFAGYLAGSLLLILLTIASAVSLYHYYTNPAYARDNYRAIANFIQAVGGPEDAVILHAEGQQDVFNYYYNQIEDGLVSEAPVYPLPRQRPLNETATLKQLEQIGRQANEVYAVYWATHQADPDGLIETWLNTHLFKATDRWYGNVRLASYGSPQALANSVTRPVGYRLGPHIQLAGYALSTTEVRPGEIVEIGLIWKTDAPLDAPYTVFIQLLDPANHLVAQRDAAPRIPAPEWPISGPVTDGHGLFIEPGTPPGRHRLIVGLYDSQTGIRLPVKGDDSNEENKKGFVELAEVEILRPDEPLPASAYDIQVPLNVPMLEVDLLGYDLYKTGHRSEPDTPLHPGDPVHLVAYWTANQPVQELEDRLLIEVVPAKGGERLLSVSQPPSGPHYSIKDWQPGHIVRGQYDFFLNNVEPGFYRLALTLETENGGQVTTLTNPFQIE